jgi:hypothetical protein
MTHKKTLRNDIFHTRNAQVGGSIPPISAIKNRVGKPFVTYLRGYYFAQKLLCRVYLGLDYQKSERASF